MRKKTLFYISSLKRTLFFFRHRHAVFQHKAIFFFGLHLLLCHSAFAEEVSVVKKQGPEGRSPSLLSRKGGVGTSMGADLDCQNNFNHGRGDKQNCLGISGLYIRHQMGILSSASDSSRGSTRAGISLNPFGRVDKSAQKYPLNSNLPRSKFGRFGIIDDYFFLWSLRSNLDLAVEQYNGFGLPDTSGLAMASPLDRRGWGQTALSATYYLSAGQGVDVKFVLGNGEGENGENTDPQQFFGFELRAHLIMGVELHVASSFDGNSAGSSRQGWLESSYLMCSPAITLGGVTTGFSTNRLAGAVVLNGMLPAARGLKVGLGWKRAVFSDLNKDSFSAAKASELAACESLDEGDLFVEDATSAVANTVTHSVLGANASYRILDRYVLGVDYQSRTVDTGVVDLFEPCESFVGESCQGRKTPRNILQQTSLTYGLSVEMTPDIMLITEYQVRSYDDSYNKFHFRRGYESFDAVSEVFNARIVLTVN